MRSRHRFALPCVLLRCRAGPLPTGREVFVGLRHPTLPNKERGSGRSCNPTGNAEAGRSRISNAKPPLPRFFLTHAAQAGFAVQAGGFLDRPTHLVALFMH